MSWTLDGTEIRNHEGHKLASARYGPINPCSMKVSAQEQQEALQLMVKAPEMWAALLSVQKLVLTRDERDPEETARNIALVLFRVKL